MGDGARQPSAVFWRLDTAESWIAKHQLSGWLTSYPVDTSVYDWAIQTGRLKDEASPSPKFIADFSSAHSEHYHYENGVRLVSTD